LTRVLLNAAEGMLLGEVMPTAEAAGRLPPSVKSMNVSSSISSRRCLFGCPSPDVSAVQAYLDESSRRRWNFDFAAMQPLSAGRFEWRRDSGDTRSRPVVGSSSLMIDRVKTSSDTDVKLSSPNYKQPTDAATSSIDDAAS